MKARRRPAPSVPLRGSLRCCAGRRAISLPSFLTWIGCRRFTGASTRRRGQFGLAPRCHTARSRRNWANPGRPVRSGKRSVRTLSRSLYPAIAFSLPEAKPAAFPPMAALQPSSSCWRLKALSWTLARDEQKTHALLGKPVTLRRIIRWARCSSHPVRLDSA